MGSLGYCIGAFGMGGGSAEEIGGGSAEEIGGGSVEEIGGESEEETGAGSADETGGGSAERPAAAGVLALSWAFWESERLIIICGALRHTGRGGGAAETSNNCSHARVGRLGSSKRALPASPLPTHVPLSVDFDSCPDAVIMGCAPFSVLRASISALPFTAPTSNASNCSVSATRC